MHACQFGNCGRKKSRTEAAIAVYLFDRTPRGRHCRARGGHWLERHETGEPVPLRPGALLTYQGVRLVMGWGVTTLAGLSVVVLCHVYIYVGCTTVHRAVRCIVSLCVTLTKGFRDGPLSRPLGEHFSKCCYDSDALRVAERVRRKGEGSCMGTCRTYKKTTTYIMYTTAQI